MRCCLPSLRPAAFPPPSPPPISVSFVRCFNGTTQPSDSSSVPRQLRLLDFLSRPGIAQATAGQTRSPRFRRDPSVRDVASDPGRATVPRITAPHMLPSAVATASAPAISRFRGSIPHPKRSLCTLRRGRHLPRRNTRYRAGATPFPDRTFTRWTAPASPGAPLLLHRKGLAPSTPCRSPGALRNPTPLRPFASLDLDDGPCPTAVVRLNLARCQKRSFIHRLFRLTPSRSWCPLRAPWRCQPGPAARCLC